MSEVDVGRVCGFMVVHYPDWEEDKMAPLHRPYGVRTGRLRSPGNFWPKVFDYFWTRKDAETWIRDVLVPSRRTA